MEKKKRKIKKTENDWVGGCQKNITFESCQKDYYDRKGKIELSK